MGVNFLALLIQQILDQVIRSSYQMYHLLDMLTMANKQMMDKQNDLPNLRMPYRNHTLRARVFLGKESNAPINLMFQTPPPPPLGNPRIFDHRPCPGGRNGKFEPFLARVGNFDLKVSVLFSGIHVLF